MNNNFNFSKNAFNVGNDTKIAGNRPINMNNDGGRMSVEEVRNRQIDTNLRLNNNNLSNNKSNNEQNKNPNTYNQSQNYSFGNNRLNDNHIDSQNEAARSRIQAMRNINNNGGF